MICRHKANTSTFRALSTSGTLIFLLLFSGTIQSAHGANIIADHSNWNSYTTQSQQVIDNVSQLNLFFAHASVGSNIMSGFSNLHTQDSTTYPLQQTSANATPPAGTTAGMIYEYPRGNPGWSSKVSLFESYIANGWHDSTVQIVMNKFCYIDQVADWTAYRDSMVSLEAAYPTTTFVYWTMPLTTGSDSNAVARAQFNRQLRNWIATQDNKVLFDIADIEAWDESGNHQTFTYNGQAYEQMVSAYTSDGGHLNQTGADRMATGLYSLLGLLTASDGTSPDTAIPVTAGVTAFPNPGKEKIQFTFTPAQTEKISINIYNLSGERISSIVEDSPAGRDIVWNCPEVSSGIYLAKFKFADGKEQTVKIAVQK